MDAAKSEMLTSHAKELVKQYITYDGFNRMEKVYIAHVNTPDGGICLITQYVYDGVTTRIIKSKEYPGTWLASYEI